MIFPRLILCDGAIVHVCCKHKGTEEHKGGNTCESGAQAPRVETPKLVAGFMLRVIQRYGEKSELPAVLSGTV